jgi:protein-disulfide isomerase
MNKEVAIVLAIGVVVIAIGAILFTTSSDDVPAVTEDVKSVIKDTDHKIGKSDAKVTIVEFADFECPACAFAHTPLKQIKQEYKDSGKLNFVFKHFPLTSHRYAFQAAQATEAAAMQNKFWEMHDLIYENQKEWAGNPEALNKFSDYARSLNLDMTKFDADMKSAEVRAKINTDMEDGNKLSVDRTPTIFINGERQTSIPSYDELKQILDAAQ